MFLLLGGIARAATMDTGDKMDQGAALKKAESLLPEATEAFDSEFVVASNDAVVADSTDSQIELLREKINKVRKLLPPPNVCL